MPDRRGKRRALAAAALLIAVLVAYAGCMHMARHLVDRTDARAPRDPATGVLLGAEARALGPANSPACAILVHGYLGAGQNFGPLPPKLAEAGWRVRVLRLPGHGTSPRDLQKVSPDDLLDAVDTAAADARASHRRVALVGHSMGGALCTLVAAQRPVDRLVLAAPYFGVTHRWYYGLRPETWARVWKPLVPWLYKGDLFVQVNRADARNNILSYRWAPMESVTTLMALGARASDPALLNNVRCPVLLLHGPGDQAASPEAATRALAAMGTERSEYVRLERSNHHLFFDHDREEAVARVLQFLGPPDAGAGAP
jgi:carboxylesterase